MLIISLFGKFLSVYGTCVPNFTPVDLSRHVPAIFLFYPYLCFRIIYAYVEQMGVYSLSFAAAACCMPLLCRPLSPEQC